MRPFASKLFVSAAAFLLACSVAAMDHLRVAFQWKQLDFAYPDESARQEAIERRDFVPENNLPLGLEVYGDRLFVTVPRWKSGVAASLTYIKLTDPMDSPKLHPYPSWEAHSLSQSPGKTPPEIVSPFRIRADRCGRLWVLDTGVADLLGATKTYTDPVLLIYDLSSDSLLRKYEIPKANVKQDTFFANIAVEDHDCDDTYAYLGDLGAPAIVVYSWRANDSWQVTHNYFHIDPMAGEFNVSGIGFQWTDGVFGMALSSPDDRGYSTMYFHPMTSTYEFSVSTEYLRNPAKENFHKFNVMGTRGPNAQSSVSFLDQKTGVLFYALVNLNAIACWKTQNPNYDMRSQGRVYMNNVTMVFPNDIKVDAKGNVWVLSDRLPMFMYSRLNETDVNFRVLTAPVVDAIRGTACDAKLVVSPNITNRIKPQETNTIDELKSAAPGVPSTFCVLSMVYLLGKILSC